MSAAEKANLRKMQASENLMSSLEESLETPAEKKKRMISLYIVHLSMLVVSLGSSIIFTGVYPYLISLDANVALIEYGLVVSADAAAQMICAPLFGMIIDKIGTVRPVALICCTLFCGGNIFYALIGMFDRNRLFGKEFESFKVRVWMMLLSRFVVGAGTGLNSAGRYYVATATLISERTTHIALLSLFQTLGFIAGPGIQAALTPLKQYEIGPDGKFFFDMYTSTGWVSAVTGILCFILYLPFIFEENYISFKEIDAIKNMAVKSEVKTTAKELVRKMSRMNVQEGGKEKASNPQKMLRKFSTMSMVDGGNMTILDPGKDTDSESLSTENETESSTRPPLVPVLALIYNYFSFLCNFVLLETIMTTLAMDQWGWKPQVAITRMGFIIMGAGAISIVVFGLIGPLSKRFDERKLLITCGILPMILGRIIMFPIPGGPNPPIKQNINCLGNQVWDPSEGACINPSNATLPNIDFFLPYYMDTSVLAAHVSGTEATGCSYEWCTEIPRIEIWQFMVGFVVATAGYPFCLTLSGSIYSKVLGSSNPGFWLGLFATSGSVARVVGPLLVTEIYEQWGTYVMFSTVTATLIVSLIATLCTFKYLVPAGHGRKKEGEKDEGKIKKDTIVPSVPEMFVNPPAYDKTNEQSKAKETEASETAPKEIGKKLTIYEEDEEGSD